MRGFVIAVLLLSPALQAWAEDGSGPNRIAGERDNAPDPRLIHLQRILEQHFDARSTGSAQSVEEQRFLRDFRTRLDATMGAIPANSANRGLYAQMLARLGRPEARRALVGLDEALQEAPRDPGLLIAKARLLYGQQDYAAAADAARAAWEMSGRKDPSALALFKLAAGRGSSEGAASSPTAGTPSAVSVREPSASAAAFMRRAVEARRHGNLNEAWSNAQAAMNEDPRSVTVQKFYELARLDKARYDPAPTSAADVASPVLDHEMAARGAPNPARGAAPMIPLAMLTGVGMAAFGLYRGSRRTYASEGGLNPSPEISSDQKRRNYRNSIVLIGTPIAAAALVFCGPRVLRAVVPMVSGVLQQGRQSLVRMASSEAGAVFPKDGEEKVGQLLTGYTRHGLNQAISRDGVGVSPAAIAEALKSPVQVVAQDGGKTMYVGRNATVILSQAGKVITTWANTQAGARVASGGSQ